MDFTEAFERQKQKEKEEKELENKVYSETQAGELRAHREWRKQFEYAQQKSCVVCFKNTNVCECNAGNLAALWHEWTGV
jgi:hypothetical protein